MLFSKTRNRPISKYGSKTWIKDKTSFYTRPFTIKELHKLVVDKEMRRGCLLWI